MTWALVIRALAISTTTTDYSNQTGSEVFIENLTISVQDTAIVR